MCSVFFDYLIKQIRAGGDFTPDVIILDKRDWKQFKKNNKGIMKTNKPRMTAKEQKQFKKLADPLMKFLAENHNPHTKIIIESTSAEIVEGIHAIHTTGFLKD